MKKEIVETSLLKKDKLLQNIGSNKSQKINNMQEACFNRLRAAAYENKAEEIRKFDKKGRRNSLSYSSQGNQWQFISSSYYYETAGDFRAKAGDLN